MRELFSETASFPAQVCLLVLAGVLSATVASAQDVNRVQTAPPPLKLVSNEERAQISAARDHKARLKISLELADTRLKQAESSLAGQLFERMVSELGVYQGIIEDLMKYLGQQDNKKGKLRDLYKKLELALRDHAPRLESIRRGTPAEYAVHVKAVADFARDARADALNAFYDDTVIPEGRQPKQKPEQKPGQPESQTKKP